MKNFLKDAINTWVLWLTVSAEEARTGIKLIEAAEHDDFQRELMRVSDSPEARQKLRDSAIMFGQLGGIDPMELADMVVLYRMAELRGITKEDIRKIGLEKRVNR